MWTDNAFTGDDDVKYSYVIPLATPDRSEISEILPGFLYLSGLRGIRFIQESSICNVISVLRSYNFSRVHCGAHRFSRHMYDVDDSEEQNMLPVIEETNMILQRLEDTKQPVLVHCASGISRSVTVVIAYLLHSGRHRMVSEAHAFVENKRPGISPNSGFMDQLMRWNKEDSIAPPSEATAPNSVFMDQLIHWNKEDSIAPPSEATAPNSVFMDQLIHWNNEAAKKVVVVVVVDK
jgi:protein-tyrosine phosphatase